MNACASVRLGMMTINYRTHCSILDNNDAGNYEEIILSDAGGHGTPEAIRASLTAKKKWLVCRPHYTFTKFFQKVPSRLHFEFDNRRN